MAKKQIDAARDADLKRLADRMALALLRRDGQGVRPSALIEIFDLPDGETQRGWRLTPYWVRETILTHLRRAEIADRRRKK